MDNEIQASNIVKQTYRVDLQNSLLSYTGIKVIIVVIIFLYINNELAVIAGSSSNQAVTRMYIITMNIIPHKVIIITYSGI